jgi:dipeptidyl aminopeptidase/acylaminoacyl peptidase
MLRIRNFTLLLLFASSLTSASDNYSHEFPEANVAHLHDFRSVSFAPDGKKLLLVVCNEDSSNNCNLSQIDIATGKRTRFNFYDAYVYRSARYSPNGKFILITRVRKSSNVIQSLENTEIVLLSTDTLKLRVLPVGEGFKSWPALSPDSKRIAFWRGEIRSTPGKTLAHNYDAYELSLDDNSIKLFGPNRQFFGVGPLQYLRSNELLANADTPVTAISGKNFMAATVEFGERTRHSRVYRIKRDDPATLGPVTFGIDDAQQASADSSEKIYLFGYDHGLVLRSEDKGGNLKSLKVPANDISGLMLASTSPDGRYVAFVYSIGSTPASVGKFALGLLEVANSHWRSLDLAPISSAEEINIP